MNMSIQLTDNAAQRVKHFLEKENGLALRLGVRKTGCSGWAYEVTIASELGCDDQVFEDKGVKIVVDNESLPYLQGSQIDFTTSGLNRVFKFDNPNATDECGCGESFTISGSE
jgi:iron-sulfur cluster assembly protein